MIIVGQKQMATLTDKWYKEVSQRSTTESSSEDDMFNVPAERQALVNNDDLWYAVMRRHFYILCIYHCYTIVLFPELYKFA